jgi:23S rRNA (cytidine1920-2'-O)/16S rRNA (cytidine1409-2'-O)-methyltransferase
MRSRLDLEMARRGLAESRESARRLVMAGRVRVNSRPADKPDLRVDADTPIEVIAAGREYASRGAYKLIGALDHFGVSVEGKRVLDVGASSGGFTDVLLARGATSVIALDVGYGQLALRLRNDSRVIVRDRINIRHVTLDDLPYRPDLVTIDVSFISLRLVLPVVLALLDAGAEIIALIKPQFEVGKGKVGKGGIVRDENLRRETVDAILAYARELGLEVAGAIESPIEGAEGNREYLALMRVKDAGAR